jgi:hypothetical protein
MTGRAQALPWEEGVKTTENKIHRPRWERVKIFIPFSSVILRGGFYECCHFTELDKNIVR